ncbi:MAG: hypothetical protein AB1427_17955 [Thermodesulfobacteriota bacterium]
MMTPALKKGNVAGRLSSAGFNQVLTPLLTLSVTLFLFIACAFHTPAETPVLNRPETTIIDAQSSVVMKALLKVLADKKFIINAGRSDGQTIETEWLQDGPYKSLVQAEVTPIAKYRSRLKVTLLLQKKAFMKETWEPTDKIDKTVYMDFINDVLIESYRVMYDAR